MAMPRSRLDAYAFANAAGMVCSLIILFYAVMVWFGAFEGSIIYNQYPIPFTFNSISLIIGFIETYVMGYISGWIFAKLYNTFSRK